MKRKNVFITTSPNFKPYGKVIRPDCGMHLSSSPVIAVLNAWTRKSPTFSTDNIEVKSQISFNEILNNDKEMESNKQLEPNHINFSSIYRSGTWSNDFIGNYQTTVLNVFFQTQNYDNHFYSDWMTEFDENSDMPTNSDKYGNLWIHMYDDDEQSLQALERRLFQTTNGGDHIIYVAMSPAVLGGKIKMLHYRERNDYNLENYFIKQPKFYEYMSSHILLSSRDIGQIKPKKADKDMLYTEHLNLMAKSTGIRQTDLITNERATRAIMLCMKEGFRKSQEIFSPYVFQKG